MPTFEEFIATELPKRPFASNDGSPGQVLARSIEVSHPLELVWVDIPSVVMPETFTATLDMSGNRMVVLDLSGSRSVLYADNTVASHALRVFGMTKTAAMMGDDVEIVRNIEIYEPSWSWIDGAPIYLGVEGLLTQAVPQAPALFSLCVGFATASNRMLIQVGSPIFLA